MQQAGEADRPDLNRKRGVVIIEGSVWELGRDKSESRAKAEDTGSIKLEKATRPGTVSGAIDFLAIAVFSCVSSLFRVSLAGQSKQSPACSTCFRYRAYITITKRKARQNCGTARLSGTRRSVAASGFVEVT
jgi:hypothetical protein